MFAITYINQLHRTLAASNAHKELELKKGNAMLYDQQGNKVHVPHGKELTDTQRRTLTERNEVLDHKGHKMFRLEERASIIEH